MNNKGFMKKMLALTLSLAVCVPVFFANIASVMAAELAGDLGTSEDLGTSGDLGTGDIVTDGSTIDDELSYAEGHAWFQKGSSTDEFIVEPGDTITAVIEVMPHFADGSAYDGEFTAELVSANWTGGISGEFVKDGLFRYTADITMPEVLPDTMGFEAVIRVTATNSGKSVEGAVAALYILTEDGSCGSGSSSSNSSESSSEPTVEVVPTDRVQISGGKTVKSTVGGIYDVKSVKGIAIVTPKADVAKAAGLSDEDVANGTNIRTYVYDSQNKAAKAALKEAADSLGKTVAAYVDVDMYSVTKKGVVTKINSTAAPVSVLIGAPSAAHTYSVIALGQDGKAVTFEDTDADSLTLTVNANVFGTYAIVY